MTPDAERSLVQAAREARAHAHAPYSGFAVGAALLLRDGAVLTGANFENASYGLSLCAETVALAGANAAGRLTDVVALAVAGGEQPITPCGRCRQVIAEAQGLVAHPIAIVCAAAQGDAIARFTLDDLLPHAFGAAALGGDDAATKGVEQA